MSWPYESIPDFGDARELGEQRQRTHSRNTSERFFDDPSAENAIGAMAEIAFARMFGFEVDRQERPDGDGGTDFSIVTQAGRHLRIDVKAARNPMFLLVKEKDIGRCADILVLAMLRGQSVTFLGWEHKSVMSLMPRRDFGYGIVSHYRHHMELRPMFQLETLLGVLRAGAPR